MNLKTNIQQQQSFKAIKMVKCNTKEYNKIMQTYGKFFNEKPYIVFKNRSITDCTTDMLIKKTASKLNKSVDWMRMNCKLNNINLPDIETAPFFEISGKDVSKTKLYMIMGLIRNIKTIIKKSSNLSVPEHLRTIKIANDYADYALPSFLKFLKKNNAQELTCDKYMEELAQRFKGK